MLAMIREGNISFEFVGNLIKYDETDFYRNHVERCYETKAVDFLALNNHPLYIVEVKDFRGYRIQNKARIKNADLAIEFAQKVRDTIAGLYGAFRKHNDELRIFHTYLFYNQNSPMSIKAILLLAEDNTTNNVDAKKRSQLKRELITKIEQQLGFLSLHIHVVSISELNSISGWTIS
jgi:Holliday junction resolvase